MENSASSKGLLMLAGIGAALTVGAVAAATSNRKAAQTTPAAPVNPSQPVGIGGGGGTTTPKPTPKPTPTPAPTPAPGGVPAGPTWWAPEPAPNAPSDLPGQARKLAALLAVINPKAWALSPNARYNFALDVCLVAQQEAYPLDLLVGHMWAESACTPCMTPTKGSGAYGPLQVTRITCEDVGMAYPPRNVQEAIRTGIKYLRKCWKYGALNLTDGLRMYGLGPGGFAQFQKAGCSGSPCSRSQTVWRHECGCNGAANRYTWKVAAMMRRAAGYNLHTRSLVTWRGV